MGAGSEGPLRAWQAAQASGQNTCYHPSVWRRPALALDTWRERGYNSVVCLVLTPMEKEERLRACVTLGRSCGFDEAHCRQDTKLALRLFDLLEERLDLPDGARHILECAALLHDIGYAEGYEGHHKTAYRLIMNSSLPGLTDHEKKLVANVARYHRGARPDEKHSGYASLGVDDRALVVLLAAVLRLADGLDRTHSSAVRDVHVYSEGDRLVVLVHCPSGCDAELWAGEKKGRLLGDALGQRVEVRESAGIEGL